MGRRADDPELSLKLYHVCDLRLGYQQLIADAPIVLIGKDGQPKQILPAFRGLQGKFDLEKRQGQFTNITAHSKTGW